MKIFENESFLNNALRLQRKLENVFDAFAISKQVTKEIASQIPILLIEEIQYQMELMQSRKVAHERRKYTTRNE